MYIFHISIAILTKKSSVFPGIFFTALVVFKKKLQNCRVTLLLDSAFQLLLLLRKQEWLPYSQNIDFP